MSSVIRLVFIDVDGTLYGPQGVPECAWVAIQRALAAGLHLGLCTGRPGRGHALAYAQRVDATGWHIFESGAVVVHGSGELARVCPLPEASYAKLLELSRTYAIPFEVYTAEGGFYREQHHPDLLAHERMLGYAATVMPLDKISGQIIRAQFVPRLGAQWEAIREIVRAVPDIELHEASSPGVPGVGFNSVTAAGVSKLEAARWVAGRYGLTLQQVMMVGDGENDLELIRAAGLGVAMGDAPESVRAVASRVVGSVEECGLAEALGLVLAHG